MKKISSTFPAELIAAGVSGLPFSWTAAGEIAFGDKITQAQHDAVMAVYAAHDPRQGGIQSNWDAIKVERDRRKSAGFQVAGKWYHSDDGSKLQHLANKDTARDQVLAGGQMGDLLLDPVTGQQIVWKTMDGTWQPLTVQLAFDIVKAGKSADFAQHAAAEAHKAALQTAPDPALYDYTASWPKVFGEV